MLKINKINGHYKSLKDDSFVVLSTRHFRDGPTMYEIFLAKKKSAGEYVHSACVIHHVGLDRSFSTPNYGKVVQRRGETPHQEMRVKTVVIKDHAPNKMSELNFEFVIKEYK